MAKRKPKPRSSTFASQAAQEALLRYQPQLRALTDIQRTAEATYATGVQQARGNADATVATIDKAMPQVGAIYDRAGLAQAATATHVNANVGALPGLSPDLQAAIGLEQSDAATRVSSGRAEAQTGLQQQKVGARAGAQFATNKAHDDLVSSLQKIFSQRQGLLSDKGTFTALETSKLTKEAQDRADTLRSQSLSRGVTKRGQDLSHDDRVAALAARDKPKKGSVSATGVKLNPAGAHATARSAIAQGVSALGTLDPDRSDRHEAAPLLVTGHKSQQLYDDVPAPTAANPKATKRVPRVSASGTPVTTPDIPGLNEWATIAADVYYDGHLSRANQKILANNGYSIKSLGLPTYAQWKRQGGKRPRSVSASTSANAGRQAAGAVGKVF